MAAKWNELNMTEQVGRINELRSTVNVNGRTVSEENIVDILGKQGYTPNDKNVRLLIDGKVTIDELRNTRSID